MQPRHRSLILGSGSEARQRMLREAGLTFAVVPADIDEPAVRESFVNESNHPPSSAAIADMLAAAKAVEVSRRFPAALVVGSDQVLDCEGEILSKPYDDGGVRATLAKLSGRTHALHSSVVLAEDGAVIWSANDTASLTMRQLGNGDIDRYVKIAGDGIRHSVGAYHIEAVGIQLFDAVEGDHFTILGMPLVPLLKALRQYGVPA